MPLLRKKPFQRLHVSSDFKDDDEVFHCEVTNEIFKDYNEYCERIILCNSLVWSCSITGRSNMTYEEALQCEENAKKSLKEFPMELRIPILYLATKTSRSSFNEMMEDVYQFARDRYFVGEMVEASFTEDSWCECHVLQVIEPTEQQIKTYLKENSRSPQERQYHPPARLFRYEVEQLDCGDSDVSQLMIVEAAQVRRRKQHFSRERNRIFLRQLCEQNTNGIWVVKENVLQKYSLSKTRFDTIFAGPMPDFTPRTKKPIKQKQESIEKFLTGNMAKHRAFEKPDPLRKVNDTGGAIKKFRKPSKLNGKFKEELKAQALERKAKRQEEKLEERERKREQRAKSAAFASYIREWNKPREDLECEDLCPLVEPTPVKCNLPNEKFGDFAMILEFLKFFHEELDVGTYFPNGLNLDLLEKAMLEKEVSGPWSDLLQLLLANIFIYQAEEEDEIHADGANLTDDTSIDQGVSSMAEAVKLATIASTWCQTHQGCQLSKLTLDHATLSEILRQHLLSSGGRISELASKWRYSQRGGYTNHDDPALFLRINEPRILRALGHRSVCEFDMDDRLKLVICLINQLLTFASIRDVIEERHEKVHQVKRELKSFLIAEQKMKKEERDRMKELRKEGKLDSDEPKPKKVTRNNCEEEKRKEEYESKLKELQEATNNDQMMLYLGSDRAYRRYFRFLSIPGLFVEDDERWEGSCLPGGTPYNPELQDGESAYAYLMNKFEDEFCDKENSIKKSKKSPKKVTFADKNGVKSARKDANAKEETKLELNEIRKNLRACTGDKSCPVHCKKSGPMWNFYGRVEDVEAVINALSTRGIRESELRNNLIHEKASLISVIEECPRHKLNPEVFKEPIKELASKTNKKNKYENANSGYSSDMPTDSVMELSLRDFILDLEDKIKVGCLGSLKVISRETWRNAISKGSYDKQCDKLMYGANEIEVDVAPNVLVDKIKSETKHSRPGTPDSEVGSVTMKVYRDPGKYLGPPGENEPLPDPVQQTSIRQMACAILQLSRAIEPKYMKRPLGVDEKDKKWSSEEARERWEQSLMASTSWSQLFVHLNTLENSVAWSKSALNAQCRICRKRRDAENMLLCDGCNKGHHLYCLKPKLNAIPEGDWFCTTCKPREATPKEKTKKRKKFEDEPEDEAVLTKETRRNRAKRVAESDEEEEEEEEEEEDEEDEGESSESSSKIMTACSSRCGSGKREVICEGCPGRYHLECVVPPISRVPRGKWFCPMCREKGRTRNVRGRERERDSERLCAAAARSRIHGFAKSLLTTESTDWDDFSTSDEAEPRQTRRATKRAAEVEEEVKEDKTTVKGSMATLHELLADITHHRDSWPFLSPVTKEEVPDYHEIIKCPMDFGTIKYKLGNGDYKTLQELYKDCLLVFENCEMYNKENSSVYKAGMRLLKFFEKRCRELGLNYGEQKPVLESPPRKKMRVQESNGLKLNGMVDDSEEEEMEVDNDEDEEEDDDEEEVEEEEEEEEDQPGDDDDDDYEDNKHSVKS